MRNKEQGGEIKNMRINLGELFSGKKEILSEEARAMRILLAEKYTKRKENLIQKIRDCRENHPEFSLEDAIRNLYKEEQ